MAEEVEEHRLPTPHNGKKISGTYHLYYTDYSKSNDDDQIHRYSMQMNFDEISYQIHGKSKNSPFAFTFKGTAFNTNDNQYALQYQIQNHSNKELYNVKCVFDGDCKLINGEWYNPNNPQAFGYMAAFKSGYYVSKREKDQLATTFKSRKHEKLANENDNENE